MRHSQAHQKERGYCSECGRNVATYIPKGGDGSMSVAYVHTDPTIKTGKRCPGSKQPTDDYRRPQHG